MTITDEVKVFVAMGGRPTWTEWMGWTGEMKEAAQDALQEMKELQGLFSSLASAQTDIQRIRAADALAKYDGGQLSRSVRLDVNRRNLAGAAG